MASGSGYVSDTLPSRPLSPWAQRFHYNVENRDPLVEDSEIHSGLATEAPRLHPKYYADTPPVVIGTPVRQTLDMTFLYEVWQRQYLRGLESWQVGPLMRYVFFSDKTGVLSGGHREEDYGPVNAPKAADPTNATDVGDRKEDITLGIFHSERIQVDENNWFPFLKRERWYNTIKPDPRIGGGNWSVDNPKIWEVLSISLELLDRMLKALLADRHVWMETMLYGLLAPWGRVSTEPEPYEKAVVLLSQPFWNAVCKANGNPCPIDFITEFTTDEWKVRLETLLKNQTWGFMERPFGSDNVWGLSTIMHQGMILLDIGGLIRLMSNDITVTERCFIHFNIAATLLDFGGASEMGFASENLVFGGMVCLGITACRDLPFGAYRSPWPEPFLIATGTDDMDERHPVFAPGSPILIDRIPGLYVSKLLSRRFWDDPSIQRKSDNQFHFRRLVWGQTLYRGPSYGVTFPPAIVTPPPMGNLEPGEAELIHAWYERIYDWRIRREGWYLSQFNIWTLTPWASVRCRSELLGFNRAFARRDEQVCRAAADNMVSVLNWSEGRRKYVERLRPGRMTTEWYYHAIGLLMLAALPIRDEKFEEEDEAWSIITLFPSREAKNLQIRTSVSSSVKPDRVIYESELYDPLTRPDEGKITDFAQEDYLGLIDNLFNYVGGLGVEISMPWYREIVRTAADLRRQRRNDKGDAQGRSKWVKTWNFVVPAYTDTRGKFENGQWTSFVPAFGN
ncbi:hypothetical protein GGR58DRAFT_527978 [Xylaria digitata]|nr:hypothetical protein GGR58DRAFT_527978 [Xylaria digitata]